MAGTTWFSWKQSQGVIDMLYSDKSLEKSLPLYSVLAKNPDLRELVQMFVDEMPHRIEKLTRELTAKDWQELLATAHQLKGSAGSYGFQEISPAAGTVEDLIRADSQESDVARAVHELVSICQRVTAETP